MTNDEMRVKVVAVAIHRYDLGNNLCSVHAPSDAHWEEARAAVAALDKYDKVMAKGFNGEVHGTPEEVARQLNRRNEERP
jgi:hypothetical protein